MKLTHVLTALLLGATSVSCIQDEALNVEAAIDGCSGANIQLLNFNEISREMEIYVFDGANIAAQELNFELPEGATISPNEAEAGDNPPYYDFSTRNKRKFTVTSEDHSNQATYSLNLYQIKIPLTYSFENLREINPYHVLYITDIDGIMQWASGNPGYKLCGMAKNAQDYPTVQTEGGKEGKCVTLTTRDTGSFGSMTKMPIAAGNLFVGSFDATNAVVAPLKATLFGFPFTRKPVRMTGWYKYKAGDVFTDKNKQPVPGQKDAGDIYAVLYEAPTSDFSLDGDLFTPGNEKAKNIVALARINEGNGTPTANEWTQFDLEFKPQNNKTIDEEGLKNGKYKLAIVFSSSIRGAYFEGAIGSQLCIDEVKIECEDEEIQH